MTISNFKYQRFAEIDLDDPFFDSLKREYREFKDWFLTKTAELAYTSRGDDGLLDGFLYLKRETGSVLDVEPSLPGAARLKIGTFKITPRGTRLGERFIKKSFDHALAERTTEIYVTVFPKHEALIQLLARYGFTEVGRKQTDNGEELVLLRDLYNAKGDVVRDYPLIPIGSSRQFLLALYPEWHSRLLPDSILRSEDSSILADVSHTNSIHKIYLAAMKGVENFRRGDTILIYRTSDGAGPAHYRSVVTSVCVVEELRHISDFRSLEEFLAYCQPYSVFTERELRTFYTKRRYPWIIRFTYNLALPKRPTRQMLIDEVGLDPKLRWGVVPLSKDQFLRIVRLAQQNENPLIH